MYHHSNQEWDITLEQCPNNKCDSAAFEVTQGFFYQEVKVGDNVDCSKAPNCVFVKPTSSSLSN